MRENRIKRPSPEKRILSFIYATLSVVYTTGLAYIVFFARRRWSPASKRSIHIIPFRDKSHYLQTYSMHIRPEHVEFCKDLFGNILLFVPLPLLLLYLLGIKSFSKLFIISASVSFVIETIQYTLNIGVADIDDLLLNSTGALIGLLILYMLSSKNNSRLPSCKEMTGTKLRYGAASK